MRRPGPGALSLTPNSRTLSHLTYHVQGEALPQPNVTHISLTRHASLPGGAQQAPRGAGIP